MDGVVLGTRFLLSSLMKESMMAITDASRYAMQSALIKAIGADEAETLMEHLPPLGWGDVATKTDLALLNAELRLEMEKLRSEMEKQRSEFKDAMHRQMVWMISTIFAAITVGSAMAGGIAAWIAH